MNRPSGCSISTLYTGNRTGVPTSMCHSTCDRSMTSEPPSRIQTFFFAFAIMTSQRREGLAHRDQALGDLGPALGHLLGRVGVDAAEGLHAELPGVGLFPDHPGDLGGRGQVGVEVGGDAGVDV